MKLVEHIMPHAEGEPLVIAPLGDIQWCGREEGVAISKLKAHIARAESMNAVYVGLGDYIDTFSPSNRQRLAMAALYDNAMQAIEDKGRSLVQDVLGRFLSVTMDKWLGLVSGHHLMTFEDGTNSDIVLADALGCDYAECLMYIRLFFRDGKKKGCYDIWMHHGCGSGLPGTVYNRLVKQAQNWPADLFLMGHTTSRFARPLPRMKVDFRDGEAVLTDKETWLVSTGGWSRAYQQNTKACYVERGMMPPTTLGAPLITVIPQWTGKVFTPVVRVEA